MQVSLSQFQAALGCTPDAAAQHYQLAGLAMRLYGIETLKATAAFLANMGHETMGLVYKEEVWGPTDAQKRYDPPGSLAARLGNTQTGDGLLFRGRGPTQLTGRGNYQRTTASLRRTLPDYLVAACPDFEAEPDRASQVAWGWLIAGEFFQSRGCIEASEAGFDAVCIKINGGRNGIDDRRRRFAIAMKALSTP
jgi:predicted chitinase